MNANKNIRFEFQANRVSKIFVTLNSKEQSENDSIIFSITEFCKKMRIEHEQLITWLTVGSTIHLNSNFLACPIILKEFIAKYLIGQQSLASVIPFEKYSIVPRMTSCDAVQSMLNLEMVNGNSVYSSPIPKIKRTTGHLIETKSGVNIFLAIISYSDNQPDTVFYNHLTPEFFYRSWKEVSTIIDRLNGPTLQMKPVSEPITSSVLTQKHQEKSDPQTSYKNPLQFGGYGNNPSIKQHVFGNPLTTTIHGGSGGSYGNQQYGVDHNTKMFEGGQSPICFTGKIMGSPSDYGHTSFARAPVETIKAVADDEPKRGNIAIVKRDRVVKYPHDKETYGNSYFSIKVREPFVYEEIEGYESPDLELLDVINQLTGAVLSDRGSLSQITENFLLDGEYTIIEHHFGNFIIGGRGDTLTDLIFPNPSSPEGIPLIYLKLSKVLSVFENKNTGHLLICCSGGINTDGKIMYCVKANGDDTRKKSLIESVKEVLSSKQ